MPIQLNIAYKVRVTAAACWDPIADLGTILPQHALLHLPQRANRTAIRTLPTGPNHGCADICRCHLLCAVVGEACKTCTMHIYHICTYIIYARTSCCMAAAVCCASCMLQIRQHQAWPASFIPSGAPALVFSHSVDRCLLHERNEGAACAHNWSGIRYTSGGGQVLEYYIATSCSAAAGHRPQKVVGQDLALNR